MPEKSISFSPDQDFEEKVKTGDASTTTIKDFFKNYDRVKLGIEDAEEIGRDILGLYWDAEGKAHLTEKDGSDELIDTKIDLGESGKGKLLVVCEKGIENTVRELADDDDNHLPSTKTGVVIHYVIEGIARDFGITFNRQPVSTGGGRGGSSKSAGIKMPSKKEKNEILDRCNLTYYQEDIDSGKITLEDALASIQENYKIKKDWENKGIFLSPNKTEGVMLYNWKKEIIDSYDNTDTNSPPTSLYTRNKIEVVIPNVWENYFIDGCSKANKSNTRHLSKSGLLGQVWQECIKWGVSVGDMSMNEMLNTKDSNISELKTKEQILEIVGHKGNSGKIKGIHLAKVKQSGMMKPRYIVVDVLDGNRQSLYLYHPKGNKTFQ
mgnify:CR=1 FL=1|jgi:hypothetical protein